MGVIYFYFTPIGAALGVGPQKKRKILLNFLQNSEYERFAPLYFLHYFYEIFRDCGPGPAGQALKFWEIRLRGSRVNVGLNLRVPVTPDFQHPLAAKLCVRPQNVSRRENMLEVLCHDAKFSGAPTSLMGSQTC